VHEPPLERKGATGIAACHYPLTREEVALQLPIALTRERSSSNVAPA
jgi:hypothetical protein